MRRNISRRNREAGNAIVEFALVAIFLVSMLMGTFSIGMTLTRSVQAGVVSRDAGAMFMRYVDFTITANKNILVRLLFKFVTLTFVPAGRPPVRPTHGMGRFFHGRGKTRYPALPSRTFAGFASGTPMRMGVGGSVLDGPDR